MDFQTALAMAENARKECDEAGAALKAIPGVGTGRMGLTPDDVRASPEYRAANARYRLTWDHMRNCNSYLTKYFKKEYSAWIKAQREARLKGSDQ